MTHKTIFKKVMVFGVFDRLHAGHISFLQQASAVGKELIVVVARDASVQILKHKTPYHSEQERMQAVRKISCVYHVVLGDRQSGAYEVIQAYQPDVICFGYDQSAFAEDIVWHMQKQNVPLIRVIKLNAYKPEVFHTSLLT